MVGIIGALQIEVDAIKAYMKNIKKTEKHGHIFYEGTLNNHQVVLLLSGVGKVAASMATTILLAHYKIDYVINIGTAGGMEKQQNTLDVVISKRVIQYDFDTSSADGEDGKGLKFNSCENLAKKVQNAFKKGNIQAKMYIGDIASGDRFISETSDIEYIKKSFPTVIACEMEAGAIAQVCSKFNVEFIVVRSLSDIVYHDNSAIDFKTNVEKTSKRSAEMVVELLNG